MTVRHVNPDGTVSYMSGLHLMDFVLTDQIKIWAPIGRGFYFPGWDWTDAPYRKADDREVSGTGYDEKEETNA